MKVILQRDIPKVGKGGDVVTVADGYARNYLFPRAYAVSATGGALREHTLRLDREKARTANQLHQAQTDASKLQGYSVSIIGKANPGSTKLYGSITAQDLADHLAKETGVAIDKRRIGLADPIKSLGDYRVSVRLHNDVVVNLPVAVLTEEQLEKRKADAVAAAVQAEAAATAASEAMEATDTTADTIAEPEAATIAEPKAAEAAESADPEHEAEPAVETA